MKKCIRCGVDKPETEYIKGAKLICNPCRGIGTKQEAPKPRELAAIIMEWKDGKQERYIKE